MEIGFKEGEAFHQSDSMTSVELNDPVALNTRKSYLCRQMDVATRRVVQAAIDVSERNSKELGLSTISLMYLPVATSIVQ